MSVAPATHASGRAPTAAAPPRASAIYRGVVTHRRRAPVAHAFRARLQLYYLDLGELPQLFDGHPLWSARGRALGRFRRADYLGDPATPLDEAVRDLVHERLGSRPTGPVRMLAHLRTFGQCVNPVTFYWCFDATGERIEAVVAEVTNTPWGERHAYVAPANGNDRSVIVSSQDKALHLSPLMPMDVRYEWTISSPQERIAASIVSVRAGEPVFDAHLSLRRRPLTRRALTIALLRDPFPAVRVLAGIYGHALRLRLKGAPWHARPERAA